MKANPVNVLSVLQGTKVFHVPIYQRRYSWSLEQWRLLWDDIEVKLQEQLDGAEVRPHFLGNIVLQVVEDANSTVSQYMVIDGQQRLVSILTLLAAIRDAIFKADPAWNQEEYDNKYLLNPYDKEDIERLVPTEFDRSDYVSTIHNKRPAGAIGRAYIYFTRQLQGRSADELRDLGGIVLKRMQVISIEVDGDDPVNTIFNTLNSRGRPLLPPDLIRNELLSHLSGDTAESVYRERWLPIEKRLVSTTSTGSVNASKFVTFFWSREVPFSPRLSKKSLYSAFEGRLRRQFDSTPRVDRSAIVQTEVESIWRDFAIYSIVVDPEAENGYEWCAEDLRQALVDLNQWGSETHIPVSLWVLSQLRDSKISCSVATFVMQTIVDYIIARAIVGVPTNSLNRALSGVPALLEGAASDGISEILIRELTKSGFRWPSRESIESAFGEYGFDGISSSQRSVIMDRLHRSGRGSSGVSGGDLAGIFAAPQRRDSQNSGQDDVVRENVYEVLQLLSPYQYTSVDDLAKVLREDVESVKSALLSMDDALISQVRTRDDRTPDWLPANRHDSVTGGNGDPNQRDYFDHDELSVAIASSDADA